MARHRIGAPADFAPSTVTRVKIAGNGDTVHAVAVIRIGDTLYAIGDRCSHANVSLSDGTLWEDECELECPKHGSTFSLTTGEPQSFPATQPVPVHFIESLGDDVFLTLDPAVEGSPS